MKLNDVKKYRLAIEQGSNAVERTDSDALAVKGIYPIWQSGVIYIKGYRVLYDNILYTVLQNHTSEFTWTPDVSPSLFTRVLIPDVEIIPDWVQPESTNPYMKGDKVKHNEKVWISDIDNNVWEPSVYGWTEQI